MLPIPHPRAWLLAAIALLACLTLGVSAAAADEPEGGGETPPTEEAPAEPPTESEPPPVETTPVEPETTTESPKTTPESPHATEAPSESSSPGPAAPNTTGSPPPSGPSTAPARHHHSSGGGTTPAPQHTSGGTGKGIKVTDPLKSITSGVDSIFSGALAPQQLDKVGQLLADSGLAPAGNKKAQHRAARRITNALGAALLGSAVGLSPPAAAAAPQPIPFVPIHGGPKYLYLVLLALLLGGVAAVLFYQLRPVIRSRQPRPPLISGLETGPSPGPGPGRVSLPREPARAPKRLNPGRRRAR